MKRSFLTLLMTALFAISLSATEAEAARFRRSGHFRTSSSHAGRYTSSWRVSRYPRARQIDGRSHWDLGKQNGQWPTF